MITRMKIGYLGPQGSFSEEAAIKAFGEEDVYLFPCSSIDLFKVLEEGKVDKIVIPLENAMEGGVNWVIDWLIAQNGFWIEREIILLVRYVLAGYGKLEEVKTVFSHPQALGQNKKFLDRLDVKTIDTDSTSDAIVKVAGEKKPELAAIGTKRAVQLYGVPIILEEVWDIENNKTRFLIVENKTNSITDNDKIFKTSIVFQTENKPGALCEVLEVLKVLGVNMTMLISRPSKISLGEYIFYIDIDGHIEDEDIRISLRKLKTRTTFLKILGSYPKAINNGSM